jgi:formylmethanofuran dehydrogenase subunit C
MTPITLNPILRAEDLFDSLKPEEKQETRKIEIKKSERLEEIVKCFEKVLKRNDFISHEVYNKILEYIKIIPTSKEILEFSILLIEYQDNNGFKVDSGFYLSALINKSYEKEFIINTRHLEKLPYYIGFRNNGKIIYINSDAGMFIGNSMQSGEIHVENAGDFIGRSMQGGIIHVKNAGDYLGNDMQGGTIHVKNAGYIGYFMQGGTINIKNNYKSISDSIQGGNIYHKGRLIVKDGVKLI